VTRVQAANLVDALDEYLDAREAARESLSARFIEDACRERLISALADEEPTKPLSGNAT
jgi:hypothetical protein